MVQAEMPIVQEPEISAPVVDAEVTEQKEEKKEVEVKASVGSKKESIKIINYRIPAIGKIPDDVLTKMDSLITLVGAELPDGTSPRDIFANAKKCEEVAHKYKKYVNELKKSAAQLEITHSAETIKMSWHDRMATDIKLGRTVAVRGPAGNGKSTGVKSVLEAMGYNVYHLDCTDSTTAEQLVGGATIESDGKGNVSIEFKDGLFTKAFSDPKGAIQLDEFDALDPRVTMVLQSALVRTMGEDGKRYLSSPDHPKGGVTSKGTCPVVVTMNTFGNGANREYVGRNSIDIASLDRFDSIIDTDYESEEKILQLMGLDDEVSKELVSFAFKLRKEIEKKALRIIMSTRRLKTIAESVHVVGLGLKEAFESDFLSRLDSFERDAFDEFKRNESNFKLSKSGEAEEIDHPF